MRDGVIVAQWNSPAPVDGDVYGIWWERDDVTLYEAMERYLAHGETTEILSYTPDHGVRGPLAKAISYDVAMRLVRREKDAHATDKEAGLTLLGRAR